MNKLLVAILAPAALATLDARAADLESGWIDEIKILLERAEQQQPFTCSNATLKGTYTYIVNGLRKNGEHLNDHLEMGFETYDGQGNIITTYTDNRDRVTYHIRGTYTVDETCQGRSSYGSGSTYTMYVPPNGDHFYYMRVGEMHPGEIQAGQEHRLTEEMNPTCSTATLKGTYSYAARGTKYGILWAETGFESFDGKGNVVNVMTNYVSNRPEYYRGTYSVDANCLGVTEYESERYAMFVAPDGKEFNWMQIDGLHRLGMFGGKDEWISDKVQDFGAPPAAPLPPRWSCEIPEGTEPACGEGYEFKDGICQFQTGIAYATGEWQPLPNGPAAVCPGGAKAVRVP